MKGFLDQAKSMGRRTLAVAVAAGAIGFAGAAYSDPINFIPPGSDFAIKFVDREIQITTIGQELFGLFNITQINSADGLTTYWNGNGSSDGTQLVGYFQGLIAGPDQTGTPTGISFHFGDLAVFDVPNGTYSPGTNPNTKDYLNQLCGGSATCLANPWLTANFVPGQTDAFGPTADATLQAVVATTNVNAGFGFLSVTGGANGAFFDTNGFHFTNFPDADLHLRSNFALAGGQICPTSASNGWQVCSDDPIVGSRIPEPGTLLLLGLGALALGAIRKNRAA
jgi:hypothetical protein